MLTNPTVPAHPQKSGPRFRFPRLGLIAAAAVVSSCAAILPAARAQTATASVSETNVETGESVEYQIQVSNADSKQPPVTPRVDGLTITFVSEAPVTQITMINGDFRYVKTTTYTYTVDTSQGGRFTIPGQNISTNKGTLAVRPVTLNVTGADSAGTAGNRNTEQARFLELTVAKKTAYVGESVPVELHCYFGTRLRFEADANAILSGEGFSVQKFAQPQLDTKILEGVPFNVVNYRTSITFAKSGQISVGPVELNPVVQVPRPQARGQQRQPSDPFYGMFNNPFGQMNGGGFITKREKLQSEPVVIQVKPLPPGAPEDFSGAVGQFKLESTAETHPNKVQAGDPVTLRVVLRGQGNFDRIQAPVLTSEDGLQTYPASGKFKAEDDVNFRGAKTFEQVVIARNARNSLPGYRFVYLDPSTGKYATLETPPVPVKIQGTAATPPPTPDQSASAAPAVPGSPAAKPTPTPKAEDILYIRTDSGQISGGEAFLPLYLRRGFWLAQLVPLALLLLFAGIAWNSARMRNEARRRAADLHRQQSELVRTLQGEKTDRREFYSAATRLAQLKASTAVGRASSLETLTATDVCRVQGLDPATAASVEEIFHRHDELSYSGGGRVARETVPQHERRDVLATLETVGKL